MIVGLVALSLVYDIIYTAVVDLQSGAEMNGGQNDAVKRFADMIGYISFIFRVSVLNCYINLLDVCVDYVTVGVVEGFD